METSVVTSKDTTTTVQTRERERKAKSEEDHEYEDDDTSLKRIKVKTSSKQDLLDLPAGSTQSILYSNKTNKRSQQSPFDTSSSNLRINESKSLLFNYSIIINLYKSELVLFIQVMSTDFFSVESAAESSSYHTATEQEGSRPVFAKLLQPQTISGI